MSIEKFIDNEVKSNDVVLFMKGTPFRRRRSDSRGLFETPKA